MTTEARPPLRRILLAGCPPAKRQKPNGARRITRDRRWAPDHAVSDSTLSIFQVRNAK